jgi:hypothetical protein
MFRGQEVLFFPFPFNFAALKLGVVPATLRPVFGPLLSNVAYRRFAVPFLQNMYIPEMRLNL